MFRLALIVLAVALALRLLSHLAGPRQPRVIYDRRRRERRQQAPRWARPPAEPAGQGRATGTPPRAARASSPPPPPPPPPPPSDPYTVLGLAAGAGPEAVRAAYQALVRQYHPDQVSHLGPDLRELAERRTKELTAAYNALKRGGR